MPLQGWISNYPRVQALLQRPDEVLDYTPDCDRLAGLESLLAEIASTLHRLQREALGRALYRLVTDGAALEELMVVYVRVPGVMIDECYITKKQAPGGEQ